ncbi:MAG: hypothetical protein ABSG56_27295 [Bryobacteraceae bacterium]
MRFFGFRVVARMVFQAQLNKGESVERFGNARIVLPKLGSMDLQRSPANSLRLQPQTGTPG